MRNGEPQSIGERLTYIRGSVSQGDFATELGIHKNTLGNYERGQREVGADLLKQLAVLGWNPLWVLTGEGAERLGSADPDAAADHAAALLGDPGARSRQSVRLEQLARGASAQARAMQEAGVPTDVDAFVFVPRYSVRAAGGDGAAVESEQIVDWLAFRRAFLQFLGIPPSRAAIIRVRGDSMADRICDGDTVLVDLSVAAVAPARPGRAHPYIYVLRRDGDLLVKYCERSADGMISVSSHQPIWPTWEIAESDLELIGRVRWWGHTDIG